MTGWAPMKALSSRLSSRLATGLGQVIASRSRREQLLLGLCLALVTGFALTHWGWRPLASARADLLAAIARHEQALTALARLPEPPASAPAADPRPIAEILTASAAEYGLTIHRLETRSGGAELVLEQVAYDTLILWLDGLETGHRLRLLAIDLARRPQAGAVTARLTLAGGQG